MRIGVPKEIKSHEYRVGMTPVAVREATARGHQVIVETQAGHGIGAADDDYLAAGARIGSSGEEIFGSADLIVKVKEPQESEWARFASHHMVFCYLHLAADRELSMSLAASGATCLAYETVTSDDGGLPLLAGGSEVAGRMSIQVGARALERANGGRGLLLGGVPGVEPATVVVLGGGVVGANATAMAIGIGARVVVIDRSLDVLRRLTVQFGSRIETAYSTQDAIIRHLRDADLVIGGVLTPGAASPKLVTREMLRQMKRGAVLVDVSIDQGGCFETSRPTTHAEPTYVEDGIVHYCVPNMPGAVPLTSTYALSNATLPFVLQLADLGLNEALRSNPHLMNGLNITRGKITNREVAKSIGQPFVAPETALI
ncbi:alanine dehydrogenase [Burkholderia sp. FL-7-2-10-S1-D7]|uniref:alanine dehydrogenase n=1 Tax=Burkholderia sp. FL-7-2-10-S1-D7 TaxID=1637866 RepID=UPI000753A9BD|nr:alanine dehydrogenase [Burkholderia sp. FL-7-2-10-S1-D7]KVF69480.1 alanine dehydrogenase [Burkholderia sp. FL-7-2-10-S1-D7]